MNKNARNPDPDRFAWRPDRPYNDLPLLPPPVEVETRKVLKKCIEARTALAELKQSADLIPNPSVLISTLPLLEAQASSEIENIVTTTDRLFQHLAVTGQADPATKEALRYSQALMEGFESLSTNPLSTRTAELICTGIRGVRMEVRKVPGTQLTRENGEVVYTPPEGEQRLRSLLGNWERYLHEATDIDPLVRMAVGHYQFEAIHPFSDGNGRTGRIVNTLFLIQEGLLTLPILYLSRYIIQNKADYYRLLLQVTRKCDWEAWVLFMIQGVQETAIWTRDKIGAIRTLGEHTGEYVRDRLPKIYSHELINLIFELPYCRIQNVVDAGIAARQAASRYLRDLVEAGVLQDQQVGREKLFVHPKLYRLLTQESNDFSRYE